MASAASNEPTSGWKRFVAKLTAFAEAAEMDSIAYQELRIASLERRIAVLESDRPGITAPSSAS